MASNIFFSFPAAELVQACNWVTQLDNDNGKSVSFVVDTTETDTGGLAVTLSFQTREAYLLSRAVCDDFEVPGGEENVVFSLSLLELSRVIKAVGKKTANIVLTAQTNDAGQVRGFEVSAGSVTSFIPGAMMDKAPRRPRFNEIATINPADFFPEVARVGAACDKDKDTSSALGCVDFFVDREKSHVVISGTDKYVISSTTIPAVCDVMEAETFQALIPWGFSALKELSNYINSPEPVTIISGATKRGAFGYKFSDDFLCLFSCSSASPVASIQKIISATSAASECFFTFNSRELKQTVRTVFSLSPEVTQVDFSFDGTTLIVSDESGTSAIKLRARIEPLDDGDEKNARSDAIRFSFTKFVINKMFSTIPPKGELKMLFPYDEAQAVFVTAVDTGDSVSNNIVAALAS